MGKYFVITFLALFLLSCGFQSSETNTVATSNQYFSSSYRPPVFLMKDRIQRVKDIAPQIEKLMNEHALEKKIPGIAYGVVVDDSLVLASASGLINLDANIIASKNSSFRIASMTKSFTAMAILKLRDEGRLSLEDPVAKYIPEMAKVTYLTNDSPEIDIENLLTMTSGLPEDNPWGDRQLDKTDQALITLIKKGLSLSNVASLKFEYSNTGYAILGNIVSRITGRPYQEYITEVILKPLGMNNTYWEFSKIPEEQLARGYDWENNQWKEEPMLHDGSFGAMGGLITTLEDFGKYLSYHLSAWPPRNDKEKGPIKRSSLREMHTSQFPELITGETAFNGKLCSMQIGYGYGFDVSKDCYGDVRVEHGGALPGFAGKYVFYPDYGLGIIAFGNLTYTSPLPQLKMEKLLFSVARLSNRKLQVSDIFLKIQKQIVELIQDWKPKLEDAILAENFYLDESREKRRKKIDDILGEAGKILKVDDLKPRNQLRGNFRIYCEYRNINVFFTLTPEKNPKIQRLVIWLETNKPN